MKNNLDQLQHELSINFKNQGLLKQAFTHSSYVNEHRMEKHADNERLEFLGDAVLELTVSEYLFQRYQELPEGELTKYRASIVCEGSLVSFAEKLHFGSYVFLGKGEEQTGGRQRPALLADVFEAFIGALYLDRGLDDVVSFLKLHVFPHIAEEENPQLSDFKTQLQEYVQSRELGSIEYRIVQELGPAHERQFVAEVRIENKAAGTGQGRSKKEAEQQAAALALAQLQKR